MSAFVIQLLLDFVFACFPVWELLWSLIVSKHKQLGQLLVCGSSCQYCQLTAQYMFLASQDALEVMVVTESLSE